MRNQTPSFHRWSLSLSQLRGEPLIGESMPSSPPHCHFADKETEDQRGQGFAKERQERQSREQGLLLSAGGTLLTFEPYGGER